MKKFNGLFGQHSIYLVLTSRTPLEILFHGAGGRTRTETDKNLCSHRTYILLERIHNEKKTHI